MSANTIAYNPTILAEVNSGGGGSSGNLTAFNNITYTQLPSQSSSSPISLFITNGTFKQGNSYLFQIGFSCSSGSNEALVATLTFGNGATIVHNFPNTTTSSMKTFVGILTPSSDFSGSIQFTLSPTSSIITTVEDGYYMISSSYPL